MMVWDKEEEVLRNRRGKLWKKHVQKEKRGEESGGESKKRTFSGR